MYLVNITMENTMNNEIVSTQKSKSPLTQYMDANFLGKHGIQRADQITCNDGLKLSVQAGEHSYCHPRENAKSATYDHYTHFEVGFPSERVEAFMSYAEDKHNPTGTVYGYVPRELIEQVLVNYGGIKTK